MGLFDNPNDGLPDVADKYPDNYRVNQDIKIAEENSKATPIEKKFDFDGAIKAGYTPEEIVEHLKTSGSTFDFDGAVKEGYTPEEIVTELAPEASKTRLAQEKLVAKAKTGNMSDFQLGVHKSMTGIAKTGNDVLHLLGIRNDKEYQERFKEVDEWTRTYKRAVEDNDILSLTTLGEVFPSLVTLPAAVETKMALFATESFLGYTQSRADNDIITSATIGAIGGAGAATVAKGLEVVMNRIGPKAQADVFDYYRNQLNYTSEEAEKIYTDWLKTVEPSNSLYADKTRALIDYAGDNGAAIKVDIGKLSPASYKAVGEGRATRIRAIKELANVDVDVDGFAALLNTKSAIVKDNYSKVKWEIAAASKSSENPTIMRPSIPEALEEIATDRSAINELLGRQATPTVVDYIDAMPHINSILSKVKGIHKAKWAEVKKATDEAIKDSLDTADYIKWRTVNSDYSDMLRVRTSKLGEALTRALSSSGKKSQITRGRVLELIKADKDSGDMTFKSLETVIGGANTSKLEKLIIQDALGSHPDDLSWEALSKSIGTKGFVTEEGKQLSAIIDNIAKSFRTDDALKQLTIRLQNGGDTGGIGSNLLEKFHVSLVGRLFRMILKMAPTEGAKALRMSDKLSKILQSPTKLKEVDRAINNLSPGVKERIVSLAVDDTIKLLEFKPKAEIKKKIARDNKVLPTSKATVGMNKMAMQHAATSLVRELGIARVEGNNVVDSIFNQLGDSKLMLRLNSVDLSKATENQKAKRVKAIIRNEAEKLAKAISSDTGVKVGKDTMETLVEYVSNKGVDYE